MLYGAFIDEPQAKNLVFVSAVKDKMMIRGADPELSRWAQHDTLARGLSECLFPFHIVIRIPLGDFSFGRKPYFGKSFGVADAFFEDADDVRPAADMRVDETIDELGRAR